MKNAIFVALLILGLAMYIVGASWPKLSPVKITWTDAKATRLPELTERIAQLSYLLSQPISLHGGPDRGAAFREMVDLTRERELLIADFDSAMKGRESPAERLKATGITLVAVGVAVWCGLRFREFQTTRLAQRPF